MTDSIQTVLQQMTCPRTLTLTRNRLAAEAAEVARRGDSGPWDDGTPADELPVPLPMRKSPIVFVTPNEFPYDAGVESQIAHSARIVRNEMAQIEACLRSIERVVGMPEGGYPPVTLAPRQVDIAAKRFAT